jgi:hypothetical protein
MSVTSFEMVIRPFQLGPVFTSRTIIPAIPATGVEVSPDAPRLEWAGENPGDYDDIPSDMIFNNFKVEMKEDKDRRVTETVRIEQEDNPANFIDVERVKSTVMKDSQTGKEFMMKFASWDKGRS